MHCPFCGHIETKVTDSRLAGEGRQIRRRRECLSCGERFTTFETAELVMPMVVKGDRSREVFDEAKLRSGMEKALEKRPVPRDQLDEAVSRITHIKNSALFRPCRETHHISGRLVRAYTTGSPAMG